MPAGKTALGWANERRVVGRPRRSNKDVPVDDTLDVEDVSEEEDDRTTPMTAEEREKERQEEQEADTKRIIKQIQTGRKELFAKLVNRYRNQVAGIAFKMVGDYDDAKDITQMVFVKTFYNLDRFDTSKRFSTWLYRIAVNASIDYVRKFRKHKFEELDDVKESKEVSIKNPEEIFQLKELKNYVMTAAEKLNDKQRDAFIYKDVKGLEIDEIARIMGMPQATVRWYLHRARKKIRGDLQKRYPGMLSKLGIYEK
jgi:RNA polymerase sigma-70 factor (ECF subfamily)